MVIEQAVLALGALLAAHQGQFTRTLMIEPAGEIAHVILHVQVTGEERKRSLLLMERKQVEAVLAQRALDGVRLLTGTATIAMEGVELKTRLDGVVEMMIHGTFRLRGPELAVETAADADPIDLVVLPGDRPVGRATRGATGGGLKAKMGAGDRIRWWMLVDRPSEH